MSEEPGDYAGFVTRAIAFAIDVALIDLAAAFVAIVAGLGISALDVPDVVVTIAIAIGGVAYLAWFVGYFATFWSTTGQTPGARVMGVRVVRAGGGEPVRARGPRSSASRAWCWPRSRCSPASCLSSSTTAGVGCRTGSRARSWSTRPDAPRLS